MARSVRITTPIPTLEEFGRKLGLSKARLRALAPIFVERRAQGDYVVKRGGGQRASYVFSTQREAVERARELSPDRMILVERVHNGTRGAHARWRKA